MPLTSRVPSHALLMRGLSHYYEKVFHYYEKLSHYYEKCSHYYETFSQYIETLVITRRKYLIIMTYIIIFFSSGGNGLPYLIARQKKVIVKINGLIIVQLI